MLVRVGIATTEQYAAMLDAASEHAYAYPAVNVTSSQTLNAALRGFAEAESDGIVRVTPGGASYLSGTGDDARGARAFAAFAHVVAERHPMLVALHTDHCPPQRADAFLGPLLEESRRRMSSGDTPLFQSHMFDGSTLPLEENLRRSAALLRACANLGVVLELEVGVVGGSEDDVCAEGVTAAKRYTTPDDLLRVAEVLGAGDQGRYLLAATFGNVHGVHSPEAVALRLAILDAGQRALGHARPGARFQYVFHGSSGSSESAVREAVSYGVVKLNVDTDDQYAFTRAVADHVLVEYAGVLKVDGGMGNKAAYDPRAWGRQAEAAMAAQVAAACELVGSAGKSLLS